MKKLLFSFYGIIAACCIWACFSPSMSGDCFLDYGSQSTLWWSLLLLYVCTDQGNRRLQTETQLQNQLRSKQEVLDYTGTETWKAFSRMLTMAKIFEELFTPTLNGIAVSVWHVSCTPVVLHAGLNDKLWRMQINRKISNEESRRQCRLFRSGTQTLNSRRSLDYTRVNKSIVFVPMIYASQ